MRAVTWCGCGPESPAEQAAHLLSPPRSEPRRLQGMGGEKPDPRPPPGPPSRPPQPLGSPAVRQGPASAGEPIRAGERRFLLPLDPREGPLGGEEAGGAAAAAVCAGAELTGRTGGRGASW